MSSNQTFSPFSHPLYVMLKPAGARCNLACRYCYYLDKALLYDRKGQQLMSEALLEQFTRQYIEAQTQREVLFTWHGGETLLRPLSFYRKALELQQKYANGHLIDNCLQTNGTLLNDEWCRFLKDNHWLVGISIDGPQCFHDTYRRDRQGHGSFDRVMHSIELLNKHGVEWNAMAVVNRLNADYPREFYQFFRSMGCHFIQFTPIVEPATDSATGEIVTNESVRPQQWGRFLCTLFDEWVRNDVGEYFVQLFDATLANWVGVEPGVCSMAHSCGNALVMEFNGDVYSCDHFVFPQHKLGNINEQPIATLAYSEQQNHFRRLKSALPRRCRECPYEFACHGECPKNRLIASAEGEPPLNYLCEGYRMYFEHVAPYMDFMARELREDRAPANVMEMVRREKRKANFK